MKIQRIFYRLLICFVISNDILCQATGVSNNIYETGDNNIEIYNTITSPSHRYVALFGIGLADVSPGIRMRLRVLVLELSTSRVRQILPWINGDYTVIWAPHDVLIICGLSDQSRSYEISAHEFKSSGAVLHRNPTNAEKQLVEESFYKKFERMPSPIAEIERPYDAFQNSNN